MTGDQVLVPRSGPLSPRTQVRKLGTLCYELQSLLGALQAEVAAGVPLPEDELAAAVRQLERLPEKLEAAWRWVEAARRATPIGEPRAASDRRRTPRTPAPRMAPTPAPPAPRGQGEAPLAAGPGAALDETTATAAAPDETTATAATPDEAAAPPAVTALTAAPAAAPGDRAAELAALCADYEPAPPPALGLPVPLPTGWQEDPHFRLSDALILGTRSRSAQYGTVGRLRPGRQRVGLDLSEGFCLSTFSVPGGGKSYLARSRSRHTSPSRKLWIDTTKP